MYNYTIIHFFSKFVFSNVKVKIQIIDFLVGSNNVMIIFPLNFN